MQWSPTSPSVKLMLRKKYPSSLEGRGVDNVDGVRCLPFTGVWLASIAKASRPLRGTRLQRTEVRRPVLKFIGHVFTYSRRHSA